MVVGGPSSASHNQICLSLKSELFWGTQIAVGRKTICRKKAVPCICSVSYVIECCGEVKVLDCD